jgi:hypothetical protein
MLQPERPVGHLDLDSKASERTAGILGVEPPHADWPWHGPQAAKALPHLPLKGVLVWDVWQNLLNRTEQLPCRGEPEDQGCGWVWTHQELFTVAPATGEEEAAAEPLERVQLIGRTGVVAF